MEFKNNNNLVNFSNSILKHFGVDPFHNTIPEIDEVLKGHKKVVCMLFDGMGTYIQDEHKKALPNIIEHRIHEIDSTFPPTTVAATTAFTTGKSPIESGWMSWTQFLRTTNCNVDVFRNKKSNTKEILREGTLLLEDICPRTTITTLINDKKGQKVAYMPEDVYGKFKMPDNRLIARWKLNKFLKNKDELFLYHYCDNPDHLIHGLGVHHRIVHRNIKSIERFVRKVAKKNKDTLFLIFADHGLIDVKFVEITDYPDLVETLSTEMPISLEKACPTFWIKKGQEKKFEELFRKYLGNHFELYSHQEVLDKHIFGEGQINPEAEKFIGDYMAISIDEYSIMDSRTPLDFKPVGRHAGGTPMESKISISAFNK